MIGDKLVIEQQHTDRAADICELIITRLTEKYTLSIAGESGAGKSEIKQIEHTAQYRAK